MAKLFDEMGGIAGAIMAYSSESGLAGLAGFRFAQLALFATTENPDKANGDERLSAEDAPIKS